MMDDYSKVGYFEEYMKFKSIFRKYVLAQQIIAFTLLTSTIVTLIWLIQKQSSLAGKTVD